MEADRILSEWSDEVTPNKLWSFKEILSWKIPEHLLSTSARDSMQRLVSKEEQGFVCSYGMHTQLY